MKCYVNMVQQKCSNNSFSKKKKKFVVTINFILKILDITSLRFIIF